MLNPGARESKARTGRFLREKLTSNHVFFSSYEGRKERRPGKIRGVFSRMQRTLDGWLARRLHQLKASTTMDLGISFFRIFCMMCGLEKFGLVDQN